MIIEYTHHQKLCQSHLGLDTVKLITGTVICKKCRQVSTNYRHSETSLQTGRGNPFSYCAACGGRRYGLPRRCAPRNDVGFVGAAEREKNIGKPQKLSKAQMTYSIKYWSAEPVNEALFCVYRLFL